MRDVPKLVCRLTHLHDAWIVGSAAAPDVNIHDVRDWDVLVPFGNWSEAGALIPADAKPNSFGGWKIIEDNFVIDVWPGDLGKFMTNSAAKFGWHPQSGVRIVKS